MELKLENGDYLPDGHGGLQQAEEELLQRVLKRPMASLGRLLAFQTVPDLGALGQAEALVQAQSLLEGRLLERLEELVGEDGTVTSVDYSARAVEGRLQVTLTAECREEIGREVPGATLLPQEAAPGKDGETL